MANFPKPTPQELKEKYGEKVYQYGEVYWCVVDDFGLDSIIKNLSKLLSKLKRVEVPKTGKQFDNGTFLVTIKDRKENGVIILLPDMAKVINTIEKNLSDKKYDELRSKLDIERGQS